jgi:hypothetical protein
MSPGRASPIEMVCAVERSKAAAAVERAITALPPSTFAELLVQELLGPAPVHKHIFTAEGNVVRGLEWMLPTARAGQLRGSEIEALPTWRLVQMIADVVSVGQNCEGLVAYLSEAVSEREDSAGSWALKRLS